MQIKLDEQGYVSHFMQEGKVQGGIEYEGDIPENFETECIYYQLINGKLVLDEEKMESAQTAAQNAEWIAELKQRLADTDYIAVKIAEGAATKEDYAEQIAQREAWREEIRALEG